jgi:lipopolysaccharide/colanic/teichoic acid biosynthesis glycosyltransferase
VRKYIILLVDLVWVGLAPAAALLLRNNFDISTGWFHDVAPYSVTSVGVAAVLFPIAGINRSIWQYTSLGEVLRIAGTVALAIGLTLCAAFALNRLEGVARSLPIIQWLLLVAAMTGRRVAMRLLRGPEAPVDGIRPGAGGYQDTMHVLVIGLSSVTEFYLRSLAEFAQTRIQVAGILVARQELRGRLMQTHEILGPPEELPRVLAQLEVHGVSIDRIVITQPFDQLSLREREALLVVEQSHGVTLDFVLDFFIDRVGLKTLKSSQGRGRGVESEEKTERASYASAGEIECGSQRRYAPVKRLVDILAALVLSLALAPIIALVGLLVALDVGFPLVFWQLRPGRNGRRFKLYKFRTMSPPHDALGNRIPDGERSTVIGRCLRRLRLDELPQLYNILAGEMSFVGPRPLLPVDQPGVAHARLLARPGLTGWAQVNGGRDISVEDKTALDVWYLRNASFWLDVRILLKTMVMVVTGESRNDRAIRAAFQELREASNRDEVVLVGQSVQMILPVRTEKTA